MGYKNKTCVALPRRQVYGATAGRSTAGPVLLRSQFRNDTRYFGKPWTEWIFTVVDTTPEGDQLVTIQAYWPARHGAPR
jgi:hypothetical protein